MKKQQTTTRNKPTKKTVDRYKGLQRPLAADERPANCKLNGAKLERTFLPTPPVSKNHPRFLQATRTQPGAKKTNAPC